MAATPKVLHRSTHFVTYGYYSTLVYGTLFFFRTLLLFFQLLDNCQAVVTGRRRPFFPPVLASNFYRA